MRLDYFVKEEIKRNAVSLFLRLQHTNPFPAVVNNILPGKKDVAFQTYLSCLPEHIRDVILMLIKEPEYTDILSRNKYSILRISTPVIGSDKALIRHIRFIFNQQQPSTNYYNDSVSIDPNHPAREAISQWVERAMQISVEYNICISFVNYIVDKANTVGQLRTMFPDYVHLLSDDQKIHISKMKRLSQHPKYINMEYVNERRRFVAERIAVCLLLPEGTEKIWIVD